MVEVMAGGWRRVLTAVCKIFDLCCSLWGLRWSLGSWLAACILLVVTRRIFDVPCSVWDLVPWPRIEPRPPALGAQSLNHWTTREFLQWMFKAIRPGGFTQEASVDGEGQGWTGRLPC